MSSDRLFCFAENETNYNASNWMKLKLSVIKSIYAAWKYSLDFKGQHVKIGIHILHICCFNSNSELFNFEYQSSFFVCLEKKRI